MRTGTCYRVRSLLVCSQNYLQNNRDRMLCKNQCLHERRERFVTLGLNKTFYKAFPLFCENPECNYTKQDVTVTKSIEYVANALRQIQRKGPPPFSLINQYNQYSHGYQRFQGICLSDGEEQRLWG
jgi:hypothetical protein